MMTIPTLTKSQLKTFMRKPTNAFVSLLLLLSIAAGTPQLTMARQTTPDSSESGAHEHEHHAPAKLVETVRQATAQYADVNEAQASGYHPLFGCVSGPDHGAMGVHYINLGLVGDGDVDAYHPEALIYEPWHDQLQFVGVEFIVDAATWNAHHDSPPNLEGQAFQFVNSPNRYGLPAFYELHVWAWRKNPAGAFVDWNNRVTCEGQ